MVVLSLNGGRSNRLLPRVKFSFQNSVTPLYWRFFKTPGTPDDHDLAVFKLFVSLYISQG